MNQYVIRIGVNYVRWFTRQGVADYSLTPVRPSAFTFHDEEVATNVAQNINAQQKGNTRAVVEPLSTSRPVNATHPNATW